MLALYKLKVIDGAIMIQSPQFVFYHNFLFQSGLQTANPHPTEAMTKLLCFRSAASGALTTQNYILSTSPVLHMPALLLSTPPSISLPPMAVSVDSLSPRVQDIHGKVREFVREVVLPREQEMMDHQEQNTWQPWPGLQEMKDQAKSAGLWNLFIPKHLDPEGEHGPGLTNLEYAHICEITGLSSFAPEMFNCSAPDTGNMEVLLKYGTTEQKAQWLGPLLQGETRSCFAMTEPAVASSDATNIQASIERDGDEYVLNGRKWWTSGAMDPRCSMCVFMGKTDPSAERHRQQSMLLVSLRSPGVTGQLSSFYPPALIIQQL